MHTQLPSHTPCFTILYTSTLLNIWFLLSPLFFPPPRFILGDLSRLYTVVRLLRGSTAACTFTPTTGVVELAHGKSLLLSALAARSSISNYFALSSSLFLPTESNFVASVRQCLAAAHRHSIRKVFLPSIIAADVASLRTPLSLQSIDGELAVEQLLQFMPLLSLLSSVHLSCCSFQGHVASPLSFHSRRWNFLAGLPWTSTAFNRSPPRISCCPPLLHVQANDAGTVALRCCCSEFVELPRSAIAVVPLRRRFSSAQPSPLPPQWCFGSRMQPSSHR